MLELQNVSAGYDTGLVLRNVTLKVPTGSVVALLGANGAGKTTLLRTASGQLRPTAGRVVLVASDDQAVARDIALDGARPVPTALLLQALR